MTHRLRILIWTLLFTFPLGALGQVKFEILELNLSSVVLKINNDSVYIEGEADGPYVFVKCVLYNQSNKDICLFPAKANMEFWFNYKGVDYYNDVIAIPFMDNDSLVVKSNNKIEFSLGSNILLGTPLLEDKKEDYHMTLLGLLPTFRVHYKDPQRSLYSDRIWKVNIK